MFDNLDVQGAIRKAIQTEKNAMNFYQKAATLMKDADAHRIFTLLAGEERIHAGHFYKVYTGGDLPSFDEFINAPDENESSWLNALSKAIKEGFKEQKALELAMASELKLEKTLRETASKIANLDVRAVFELNAHETHNHYEMIESEYARVMRMVHESDIDTFVRE